MKYFSRIKNNLTRSLILFTIVSIAIGCSSRYRMDVRITSDYQSRTVAVEKVKFIKKAALNNPYRQEKLIPGDKSIAIIDMNYRGKTIKSGIEQLLTYDQNVKIKLYLQFSRPLLKEELPAENNSIVQMLGNFELPVDQKIFLPKVGTIKIDSLNSKHIFMSVESTFVNNQNQKLKIEGSFKVKNPN